MMHFWSLAGPQHPSVSPGLSCDLSAWLASSLFCLVLSRSYTCFYNQVSKIVLFHRSCQNQENKLVAPVNVVVWQKTVPESHFAAGFIISWRNATVCLHRSAHSERPGEEEDSGVHAVKARRGQTRGLQRRLVHHQASLRVRRHHRVQRHVPRPQGKGAGVEALHRGEAAHVLLR